MMSILAKQKNKDEFKNIMKEENLKTGMSLEKLRFFIILP